MPPPNLIYSLGKSLLYGGKHLNNCGFMAFGKPDSKVLAILLVLCLIGLIGLISLGNFVVRAIFAVGLFVGLLGLWFNYGIGVLNLIAIFFGKKK